MCAISIASVLLRKPYSKYLPGFSTEEEIVNNGLNIKNHLSVMTKQMEEFVLYIIELKKENEALKMKIKDIEKLKNEIEQI